MKTSELRNIIKEEISEVLGKVRQPSDEEYELAKRFADSKGGKLGSIGVNKKDGSINIEIDDEKFILDKKGQLLKEAGGIIDKTRAKKIARQARELIARLESLPEYQEIKAKYDEGEISKTAFQTIIRKELVTPQEIDFMHKLAHHSQISKSSWNYAYNLKEYAWSMVSQSNIARELYDVGLAYNQYAKTGPHALITSPASVYRPGFAKMKSDFTF